MQNLQSKYGSRLIGKFRPLVKKGADDAILRLFHIARKTNKEHVAINAFYQAKFKEGLALSDPQVVIYLVKKLELTNDFSRMRDSAWVDRAINEDVLFARNYQINSTPSWIVEQQLKVKTDFNNLEVVIDSLLLK